VAVWRDNRTLYAHDVAHTRDNWVAATNLAWVLATSPDASVRDGSRAVQLATRAVELTHHRSLEAVDTLAAAYAEVGRFEDAIAWQRRALGLAPPEQRAGVALRLSLYEERRPYREHDPTLGR
jgi:tetratricopeptide (TPR) repeat protein